MTTRILITGASRGIGRAIALECARRDYDELILHYHERRDLAETLAAEVRAMNKTATIVAANFANDDDIDRLVDDVSGGGRLHGFVHAVALNVFKPLAAVRPNQWELCVKISTASFVQIAARLRTSMAKGSSIVALSSTGGSRVTPNYGPMGPTKAALEAAVRQLAFEFGPGGIRVNALSAGLVRTHSLEHFPHMEEILRLAALRTPLGGTIAEPEDIACIAAFLLSADARWITGQTITADGGFSLT